MGIQFPNDYRPSMTLLPFLLTLFLTLVNTYRPACEVIQMMEKEVVDVKKKIEVLEVERDDMAKKLMRVTRVIEAKTRAVGRQENAIRRQRRAITRYRSRRSRRGLGGAPVKQCKHDPSV